MNKKSIKSNGSNKKPTIISTGIVSKAEKKALRLKANQEWKNLDRMSWSDKDTNPRHTLYYKSQLPELSEEWQQFRSVMATDLPVTFRISERCGDIVASAIEKKLEKEFKKARGRFIEVKGQVITNDLVKRVQWYPNAYQISNCDSATFSKQPSLQPLYQYISREVSLGHIVRQELVSMIPAYVLNVKHDSIVLDMCAAPGSKTEQLVALMAQDAAKNGNRPPEGLVVANDSDPKRIETLLKRFARNHSPNLMFTCSRAEEFTKHFGDLSSSSNNSSSNGVSGTGISDSVSSSNFDRILCDVPCSGDGTFRKCPHLWRLFRPRGALDFHVIQLQIVSAGISILRTGGRLVYSTCSLNPIEDEAVVCALLQRFKGQIRLVDTRAEGLLPLLKSRPGISHWECNTDILTVGEPDEKTRLESVSRLPKILKTMVAPPTEVTATMNLDRCMRIMPQDQDTGGFFVAVFELFADMPAPTVFGATKSTSSSSGSSNSKSNANSYQIVNSNKNKASSAHDAHQSIAAMKRLGYNPKNLNNSSNNNNSTGSSSAEGAQQQGSGLGFLTACRDLGGEETEMVAGVLDLDEERVYNMGVPPEERNEEGDCVLMLSEIAKEFSTIVAAATAAKNMTAEQAAELKEQEDRKQQAKKQKRFNGIFGSKSTGWAIQTEQESEDEEDALAVDVSKPSHRVVLMSKSAHEALHSWGRSIFIVQAGASIATGNWIPVSRTNEFAGFAHLNVDTAALGTVVANKSPDSVVEVNLSDFLFLLKHGMPKRFHREQQHQLALQRLEHNRAAGNNDDQGEEGQEGEEEQEEYEEGGDYGSSAEGSEGSDEEEGDGESGSEGDNESHDGDQQQSRGHKRRREENEDVDGEEEEEAGMDPFEDSVLIKRKYARMEENYIPEDEVLPDQIMLSCDGCAQVYNFVDSASGGGEDEEDEEDEDGGTVNPSFPVTLSAESWAAYFQSHAPQVSVSGAVLAAEESEEPGMHSSAGQKKRLSKAEKKRLQKTGGAAAIAVAKPAVPAIAAEPERKVVDVGALSTAPVTLLLRYEKVPFETKKANKGSGSARNYHLQLNVLSSEDACESLLATIQSHMKWA